MVYYYLFNVFSFDPIVVNTCLALVCSVSTALLRRAFRSTVMIASPPAFVLETLGGVNDAVYSFSLEEPLVHGLGSIILV